MPDLEPGPRIFSVRDLAVFIAIVSLVFALFWPWLRAAREQGSRSQCTNNLRQMGLGVQNCHDLRREIPPSYLTDDHSPAALPQEFMAWPMLMVCYIETCCYGFADCSVPMTIEPRWPTGSSHRDYRMTSMQPYFCPSRRQAPALAADGNCSVGDYACVSIAGLTATSRDEPRQWDAAMLPSRALNTALGPNAIPLSGFPPGTLQSREYRSMTSFLDITDGLSNTIFIGEKAVHKYRLGGNQIDFTWTEQAGEQDGTFYYGKGGNLSDLNAPGAIAYWSRRLAPTHSRERLLAERPMLEDPRNRFGGWHPGVTLFLLGDGSVKAISNDTATEVLQQLGCRNDRASLPP